MLRVGQVDRNLLEIIRQQHGERIRIPAVRQSMAFQRAGDLLFGQKHLAEKTTAPAVFLKLTKSGLDEYHKKRIGYRKSPRQTEAGSRGLTSLERVQCGLLIPIDVNLVLIKPAVRIGELRESGEETLLVILRRRKR